MADVPPPTQADLEMLQLFAWDVARAVRRDDLRKIVALHKRIAQAAEPRAMDLVSYSWGYRLALYDILASGAALARPAEARPKLGGWTRFSVWVRELFTPKTP